MGFISRVKLLHSVGFMALIDVVCIAHAVLIGLRVEGVVEEDPCYWTEMALTFFYAFEVYIRITGVSKPFTHVVVWVDTLCFVLTAFDTWVLFGLEFAGFITRPQ